MSQNEIVSETNYYPFGLAHKGYNEHVNSTNLGEQFKFNGKELNDEMDLGWYDFGARPYMPDINRTTTIDPLADDPTQIDKSPYAMFWNNPMKYVDPTGMIAEDWFRNNNGRVVWHDKKDESFTDSKGQEWKNVGANVQEVKKNLGLPESTNKNYLTTELIPIGGANGSGSRGGAFGLVSIDNSMRIDYNLDIKNTDNNGTLIDGKSEITSINIGMTLSSETSAPGIKLERIAGDFGLKNWTPLGKRITTSSSSFQPLENPMLGKLGNSIPAAKANLKMNINTYRKASKNYRKAPHFNFGIRAGVRYKSQYTNSKDILNISY